MKTLVRHIRLSRIITTYIVFIMPYIVFGKGSLTTISFYSNSLNANKYAQVYLPEGYNPQDSIRYPVIYFLHGASDNYTSNPQLIGILDNLISNSTISPVIVVKPDGSSGQWGGSFYTNSELYGDFEDYIVFDLIEYIDSNYKTIPIRDKRAIMGHSMGGHGAMKLALKHPDIYGGVAAHSATLDFNQCYRWIPKILSENGGVPVSNYDPDNGVFTWLCYTAAGAFSPNLNNTPYRVDFPLDNLGNFIDSTFNKWLLHDPARLSASITPSSDLAIYFDCGIQDEFLVYPYNTGFADSLDAYGLDYVFKPYIGTHGNKIYNRIPIALSFLDSVMNPRTAITDNNNRSLSSFVLHQNYPNPFNTSTTIEYNLPNSGTVNISIYNLSGKRIKVLINRFQYAGSFEIQWNGRNDSDEAVSSGIYFLELICDDYRKIIQMILLK